MSNTTIEAIRALAQKINSFDLLFQCRVAEKMAAEIVEGQAEALRDVDAMQWNRAREAYVASQMDFCEKNDIHYYVSDLYADFDERLGSYLFEKEEQAALDALIIAAFDRYCDSLGHVDAVIEDTLGEVGPDGYFTGHDLPF